MVMDTEFKEAPSVSDTSAPAGKASADYDIPAAEQALVKEWLARVERSKKHFKPEFEQMEKNEYLAAEGADEKWIKGDHYVAPIANRLINQAVAKLYARDPKAVATRRQKLLFTVWDGREQTLQAAMLAMKPPPTVVPSPDPAAPPIDTATGQPWTPDPNSGAIIEEIAQSQQYKRMVDQLGKGVEMLWNYYVREAQFKIHMKAAVRRTKVCSVSYVKLAFQRSLKPNPEVGARLEDATSQLAKISELADQEAAGDFDNASARAAELQSLIAQLQNEPDIVDREGPVFDFPRSDEIIVDKACTHLKTFRGARFISHQMDMSPEKVKSVYGVDIKGKFKDYRDESGERVVRARNKTSEGDIGSSLARVHEIQDKENGQTLTVCEGYCGFLKEPAAPDVQLERFWTIFPLVFNEIESKKKLYPPSDIYLSRHSTAEYNRSREGLREHRIANRPKYASSLGALSKTDKDKLASNAAHALLELKGLKPGQPVQDLIQRLQLVGIDPNMYDVSPMFQDIQRSVGAQEADIGGSSDASATQSSIAENGRSASLSENIDDLDEMLSELAHSFGQLCLLELSKETVVEIVGPGAVWPDMPQTREEIAKDLQLEIKAGSSGRPNKAAELANVERVIPYALQIPGSPIKMLLDKMMSLLDIDVSDMEAEEVQAPSVQAQNAVAVDNAKQMAAGATDPAAAPGAQGPQGAQNMPGTQRNEPGAQPAQPAPAPTNGGPLKQA